MKITDAIAMLGIVASTAAAGTIDFNMLDQGDVVTTQFASQGVIFNGDVATSINFGDFEFENPFVGDVPSLLAALFGADNSPAGNELINGFFGISALISVQATPGVGAFGNYEFELVRRENQDITVTAFNKDGDQFVHTLDATSNSSLFAGVAILDINLDTLFGDEDWIAFSVNDSGTSFGLASVTTTPIPMPTPLALTGMGLVGLASVRRRRIG